MSLDAQGDPSPLAGLKSMEVPALSQAANAISKSMTLPLADRQGRHAAMLDAITARDLNWWTRSYLDRLEQACDPMAPTGLAGVA